MNAYEDYDYAAIEESEAILNGTIPSTPETYAMVQQWYGKTDSLEHSPAETKTPVRARRDNPVRTVRVRNVSRVCSQI